MWIPLRALRRTIRLKHLHQGGNPFGGSEPVRHLDVHAQSKLVLRATPASHQQVLAWIYHVQNAHTVTDWHDPLENAHHIQ